MEYVSLCCLFKHIHKGSESKLPLMECMLVSLCCLFKNIHKGSESKLTLIEQVSSFVLSLKKKKKKIHGGFRIQTSINGIIMLVTL